GDDPHLSRRDLVHSQELREGQCLPADLSRRALLLDREDPGDVQPPHGCFQRTMVISVPSPGRESSENSCTSRRAPPSPKPMPLPVVKPSVSACSTSAIPGPWSTKRSCRPSLAPLRTTET